MSVTSTSAKAIEPLSEWAVAEPVVRVASEKLPVAVVEPPKMVGKSLTSETVIVTVPPSVEKAEVPPRLARLASPEMLDTRSAGFPEDWSHA